MCIKGLPDDHSECEPPDPFPNSEVKPLSADGSVGSPHVRVGHRQVLNSKSPIVQTAVGFFFALTWAAPGPLSSGIRPSLSASRVSHPCETRSSGSKRCFDSVRSYPPVRVGHRQVLNSKSPTVEILSGFFFVASVAAFHF